jgi:hypothetical protein
MHRNRAQRDRDYSYSNATRVFHWSSFLFGSAIGENYWSKAGYQIDRALHDNDTLHENNSKNKLSSSLSKGVFHPTKPSSNDPKLGHSITVSVIGERFFERDHHGKR